VLVKVAIEDEKPIAKERTTTLNNPASAKKKKFVESIEYTISTIKSVRLSVKMKK
jgi:hypothetical protein